MTAVLDVTCRSGGVLVNGNRSWPIAVLVGFFYLFLAHSGVLGTFWILYLGILCSLGIFELYLEQLWSLFYASSVLFIVLYCVLSLLWSISFSKTLSSVAHSVALLVKFNGQRIEFKWIQNLSVELNTIKAKIIKYNLKLLL